LFWFFHKKCLQPGPGWYDVLLEGNRVGWILELYARVRQGGLGSSSWMDSPLAVAARQLIVQLCSLNGNIFPSGQYPSLVLQVLCIICLG